MDTNIMDTAQAAVIVEQLVKDGLVTDGEPSAEAISEVEATILSGDTDLDDYRNVYKDALGRDCPLSEDQLIKVLTKTTEDLEAEQWVALMLVEEFQASQPEKKEEAPISEEEAKMVDISAAGRRNDALKAAEKTAQDAELQVLFARGNEATETLKRNAVAIMVRLITDHGGDPWVPAKHCEFDDFPMPGTPIRDKDTNALNNNPDEYKRSVERRDGKGRTLKSFYWWDDYAEAQPEAKKAQAVLDQIALFDTDASKMPRELFNLGKVRLKTEASTQKQRITYVRSKTKQAYKLRAQMRRIAKEFPSCLVGIYSDLVDGKKVVARTTEPFYIARSDETMTAYAFSINSFLGLNLDKAAKAGGSWQDVVSSGSKEKPEEQEKEGVPAVTIQNVDAVTGHLATFFDSKDNAALLYKRLHAKPEDSDALLSSFASLYTELRAIFQDVSLRKRARGLGYTWDDVQAPQSKTKTAA